MRRGNTAAQWKARNRAFWRRVTESASKDDPQDVGTRAGEIIDFGFREATSFQRAAYLWFFGAKNRKAAA